MKKNIMRTASFSLALLMVLGMAVTGFATTLIGTDKAKEIAHKDAGIKTGDVMAIDVLVSYREGSTSVYKYVFRTATNKYVYRINAVSGAIISDIKSDIHVRDRDRHDWDDHWDDDDHDSTVNAVVLTRDEALAIAIKKAGLSASDIRKSEVELDRENGRYLYEVELKTYGGVKYEYDIDADTGTVLGSSPSDTGSTLITAEKALSIALSHAGLTSSSIRKQEIKLDRDDGQVIYEVEFETGHDTEYEFEIDAYTGKVLKYEIDD